MIKLTIPGEPMAKGRPRFFKGHAITPSKTRNYETLIQELFIIAYPDHELIEGQLSASLDAYFSIPKAWSKKKVSEALQGNLRPIKRPDIDNIIKVLDGLNGIAFKDDSQIVSIMARKWYSHTPRLEIEIKEVQA